MQPNLKESAVHGNREFPFALYHMRRLPHPCTFSLHWHDEMELIYVEQGELSLSIDREAYLGHPGDLFLVNSRQIHKMSVGAVHTEYATILFPPESLLFQSEDQIMTQFLQPIVQGLYVFPNVIHSLSIYPQVLPKVKQLISVYHQMPPGYMLRIRVLLLDILCAFWESGNLISGSGTPKNALLHREILGYLQEHFRNDLPLEAAAEQFHMAPKYFSRYFKRTFHIAYTEYINRLRLERAAEQLRETELSITEIALQNGFNSSSYFNKQFRSVYQKTPREYRSRE